MLNILIIIGWLLVICLMLYLAKELVKDRFRARRERKLAIRNAIRARRRERKALRGGVLSRSSAHATR